MSLFISMDRLICVKMLVVKIKTSLKRINMSIINSILNNILLVITVV